MKISKKIHFINILLLTVALLSCNGNPFTVGGVVFGLDQGERIVLQNNSKDDLTIAQDSEFVFGSYYSNGSSYDVTITTQPDGKVCTVNNGSGVISSFSVTDIRIACSSNGYTVGGDAAGLGAGEAVTLQNNLEDDLTVSENGTFTFSTSLAAGSSYEVNILESPASKTCSLGDKEGYIRGENITDVSLVCSGDAYSIGGSLSGLSSGEAATLQLNLDNDLELAANGSFVFGTQMADGSLYDVTVSNVPNDKFYNLSNNSGTVGGSDVDDVEVKLCSLADMVELKTLTSESTPPIPDLDSPLSIHRVGDFMVIVTSGIGSDSGMVYLMDSSTYEVLDSHAAGYQPGDFTIANNDEIWVMNNDGTLTILQIDGESLVLIDDAFVVNQWGGSRNLNSITTDLNGYIWVLSQLTDLWKIDPDSREIVYGPVSIEVEPDAECFSEPNSMAVDAYGYLWVGQWYGVGAHAEYTLGFATKIDTDTNEIVAEIGISEHPRGFVADASGNVYVACGTTHGFFIDKISSMDEIVIDRVEFSYGQPHNLAIDQYGKYIWASIYLPDRDGAVGVFDLETLEEKPYVEVGKYAYGIAVDPYGMIWTGNIYPDTDPYGGSVSIVGCP